MRNKILLIVLITSLFIYGQSNNVVEFNADNLIGVWYLKVKRNNGNVNFEKVSGLESKNGVSFEIFEDGKFRHIYFASCLNDERIFLENYEGKWNLNKEKRIIYTSKPIDRKGFSFKIVALQSQKLILKIIE